MAAGRSDSWARGAIAGIAGTVGVTADGDASFFTGGRAAVTAEGRG